MNLRSLIILLIILLLNCGDSFNITGITETDESGPDPIGNVDENDWCSDRVIGFALFPAFPNPTNGELSIQFQISSPFWVKLQIINNDKKIVRLLIEDNIEAGENTKRAPGTYQIRWDARDDSGNRVKDGFYRVEFFLNGGEFQCHGDIEIRS